MPVINSSHYRLLFFHLNAAEEQAKEDKIKTQASTHEREWVKS